MKIDYEWIQSAIDIVSNNATFKIVNPSGTVSVEKENGVIKIEIAGDME